MVVTAEEPTSKDLIVDDENTEDLERKHRKKKKKQQNYGPCGSGGYGRTFGDKFFGSPSHPDYTYINAPVMNYFFGCGVAALPVAPVAAYPVQIGNQHGHGGHGHGGNGHGHGHGHGGHGGHGGHSGYGGQVGHFGGGNVGYNQQYQSPYNQGYLAPNRPFQNAVSAAASGFGTALADYITRPRKTYKHINKQVNQYLKPLYKLF